MSALDPVQCLISALNAPLEKFPTTWIHPTGKIIYFFSSAKPSACKEAVDSLEFVSLAEQDSDTGPVQILMNKDASLGYLFSFWEP